MVIETALIKLVVTQNLDLGGMGFFLCARQHSEDIKYRDDDDEGNDDDDKILLSDTKIS